MSAVSSYARAQEREKKRKIEEEKQRKREEEKKRKKMLQDWKREEEKFIKEGILKRKTKLNQEERKQERSQLLSELSEEKFSPSATVNEDQQNEQSSFALNTVEKIQNILTISAICFTPKHSNCL